MNNRGLRERERERERKGVLDICAWWVFPSRLTHDQIAANLFIHHNILPGGDTLPLPESERVLIWAAITQRRQGKRVLVKQQGRLEAATVSLEE